MVKGDIMDEELNEENHSPEKEEEVPSLLDVEKKLAEAEEEAVFACPECRTEVAADSTTCPGCGAMFEEVPSSDSQDTDEEKLPSISDLDEEEEEVYIEPKEMPKETPEEIPKETPKVVPPDIPKIEPVKKTAPPTVIEERKGPKDERITEAMSDYYQRRKKRYLTGALSLGIGIVMFVLVWLVVVNSVLVDETDNVFGLEVIVLLAVAAIFFIIGLFLTMTYPSSSLTKLLTSMPMQARGREPGSTLEDPLQRTQ
jgi:hypothetical protein